MITDNEAQMLRACLNYEDRESQLDDNYSNGEVKDAHQIMGSKEAGSGLLGSLRAKDLILDPATHGTPKANGQEPSAWAADENIVWLTEKGVNALFDYIEENPTTEEN